MREGQWIQWTRTSLQPQERDDLLTGSTSEQKARWLGHDHVWVNRAASAPPPRVGSTVSNV